MKKNKKYLEAAKLVDKNKVYNLDEAIKILKQMPKANFDETVEVHIRLNVKTNKVTQNVSGTVSLPNGTGKKVKIWVVAKGDKAKEAQNAGARRVGYEDIIEEIKKGRIDFDVLIATPDAMKDLSKVARIIGPKGLMPSPKTGTLTFDIADTVKSFKAGRVKWKVDTSGNIHAGVGKISFPDDKIKENVLAFVETIKNAKMPLDISGNLIKSIHVSKTMSPGLEVLLS